MTSFRLRTGILFMALVATLGDWEFTTISKAYGKGRGYWSALRLATGQILDKFRIVGDDDETYT